VLAPLTRLLKVPEERRILTAPESAFVACPAKRKTNCSGRRAGKSFSTQLWLVEQWKTRPHQSSVFMALSQESAIKIGWDALRELSERFGWGAEYNGTEGCWTLPNGFTLYYCGCKDRRSANLLRGIPKIHRLAVDECGHIPDPLLEYLVVDVAEPTLADTNGDMCLLGTPADTGVGFYEDEMARAEKAGAHFCWTAAENPHLAIPGAQFIADALAKRFGGNAANATFRREYLGHRVQEEGVLVYHTPPLSEFYEPTPTDRNYTTLGIDLGWRDGAGFVVLRSRDPEPGVHVVEAYREVELQVPRIAAIAERMRSEHGVSEIFVDAAGGGGRTICETLAGSYGLPCTPADKRARRMRIEQVRGALDGRTLRGTDGRCQQLLEEWRGLPWNLDKDDHREGYVDECTDALQYAMQGSAFTFTTSWSVEPTAEEVYRRRVEERQRAARSRARAGRR
jgi:hypothetical protein